MLMKNTHTKKEYNRVREPRAGTMRGPKNVAASNDKGMNDGQMRGNAQPDKFADPMNDGVVAGIEGFDQLYDDIGEKSGFTSQGYLDKKDTPYGEAAKFNFLPPGMDISNQENAEIHEMHLYKVTSESYPGDGWMPAPRDIPE